METIAIREILDQVLRGQIRIPAFQRGFVWESDRVAYLMDSIYKGYPFGSLLFWRTKERLDFDRKLGPFELPDPKVDYPIDYVLDGQQRVTSIFGVFQSELNFSDSDQQWLPIYFDLLAPEEAQDSQFVALPDKDVDSNRHFPLSTLFDTLGYRKAANAFDGKNLERIDKMQERFKETLIPVQISKTEDKATVAIIFERVNRQGVELNTLQLLSAWTWSDEFQLIDKFEELATDLEPFGFKEVGADTNLLLRCCSAVLSGDASPNALMEMNGAVVREQFERVVSGVLGAVDFVRRHYHVETLENLPFTTMLVPLSVFFATTGSKEVSFTATQRAQIDRWFWRTAFSRRYSSGVLRNLNADIQAMKDLSENTKSSLGDFDVSIDHSYFLNNTFGIGNVNTKAFILLIAGLKPRSFVGGGPIDLKVTLKAANRAEFHHLMPRNFLRESAQNAYPESALINFAFISRADNRKLGGFAPSFYRKFMPDSKTTSDILESCLCPESLFHDDYKSFAEDRANSLLDRAKELAQLP